ncbi:MAG: hypothetical protein JSW41_03045, partial [Candidatus Aenigmatarchaeota archaeon]
MPRIEVDTETLKILDDIKRQDWSLQGRGHSDTIRKLAQFKQDHESIEKMVDQKMAEIPGIIAVSFKSALATAVCNLLDIRV